MAWPETMKLPDNNSSPTFFVIGSDSPVIKDSLTKTSPSKILLSVQT